jgi:hypothetical protein
MKKANILLKSCTKYESLCKLVLAAGGRPFEPRYIRNPSGLYVPEGLSGSILVDPMGRTIEPGVLPVAEPAPIPSSAPEPSPLRSSVEIALERARSMDGEPSGSPSTPSAEPRLPEQFTFSETSPELDKIKLNDRGAIDKDSIPKEWIKQDTGLIDYGQGSVPSEASVRTRVRELSQKASWEKQKKLEFEKNQAKELSSLQRDFAHPILSKMMPSKRMAVSLGLGIITSIAIASRAFSKNEEKALKIEPSADPSGAIQHIIDQSKIHSDRIKATVPGPEKIKNNLSELNSNLERILINLNEEDKSVISKYIAENKYVTTLLEEAGNKTITLTDDQDIKNSYDFYFNRVSKKLTEYISKLERLYARLNLLRGEQYISTAIACEKVVDSLSVYVSFLNQLNNSAA